MSDVKIVTASLGDIWECPHCHNYQGVALEPDELGTVCVHCLMVSQVISKPLDMVIHCPRCGEQHIDEPNAEIGWDNPPHKSHLCLSCDIIWRVADVPTNGVAATRTMGTSDNWFSPLALAAGGRAPTVDEKD